MKREKANSQESKNDQTSCPAHRAVTNEPSPNARYLTCNEAELEALMSKGESVTFCESIWAVTSHPKFTRGHVGGPVARGGAYGLSSVPRIIG
jgi:hypothetical protein